MHGIGSGSGYVQRSSFESSQVHANGEFRSGAPTTWLTMAGLAPGVLDTDADGLVDLAVAIGVEERTGIARLAAGRSRS